MSAISRARTIFDSRLSTEFSKKQRRTLLAWVLLAPGVAIWLVYRGVPFFWNLYLTFFEMSYTGETTFVGLENYAMLLQDDVLLTAIFNTFVFFAAVPVAVAIALGLALLLNKEFLGAEVFRGVLFMPYITMMVAIAVMWSYIYKTDNGVFNFVLTQLSVVDAAIPWLGDSFWARIAVMVVYVWKTVGFYMVILLAGLQDVPKQVYEVASIDGAGRVEKFLYLTLPLLKPTLGICAIIGLINSFQLFDLVMVLTGTGPGHSTELLITWIYKQAFQFGNFGYAAVLTILLFVIMVALIGVGQHLQNTYT
jgi:ABC-type sugar transport system permease subunit